MTRRNADPEATIVNFQARVLQDAWINGTTTYWERRARIFAWAAPRPTDFVGHATPDDRAHQALRCAEAARACRNRAQLDHTSAVELVDALDSLAAGAAA